MVRTGRRRKPNYDSTYPWLMSSTAYVDYYYCYLVNGDFDLCFIKFCSYFPFNAKLCINGHEYLKRQLAREGIAFEALDNGILRCADPERMQQLHLSAARIDALVCKWLERLPHPFSSADRLAGLLYRVSIPQAEFSLTQVLDRPLHGRAFLSVPVHGLGEVPVEPQHYLATLHAPPLMAGAYLRGQIPDYLPTKAASDNRAPTVPTSASHLGC